MTNKTKLAQKKEEISALDAATNQLLHSIRRKDTWFRRMFVVTWTILFAVGIFGIYKQNQIASANKQHIDCIIKLFTTPSAPGQVRHIARLETCQIKVTN